MATTLQVLREHPRACQYLPGREASLDLRVMTDVSAAELEALLERGWRRFGPTYFRPACATCTACESLRIVTNAFHPTASQRRARRHASPLVRQVSRPVVDTERLELYAR